MGTGSWTTDVAPPTRRPDNPDYGIECQAALEDHIRSLCDKAGIAGWNQPAVLLAVAQIAQRLGHEYDEDPDPADSASEVSIDLSDFS